MKKFFACIQKEWLLLYRDKVALAILFIMPMFFVFVITLLQAHSPEAPVRLPVLVSIQDTGKLAQKFVSGLAKDKQFKVINVEEKFQNNLNLAKEMVAKGHYQALVILPKNMSKELELFAQDSLVKSDTKAHKPPKIVIYLDPTISSAAKIYLTQTLMQILQHYQIQVAAHMLSGILGTPTTHPTIPKSVLHIQYISFGDAKFKPDPVQQNVPAWSIFGMFFIVIPIAGILIKEAEAKITQRLAIAPVSYITLLFARLTAFAGINLLQLFTMLCVGIFILPLFGLQALVLENYVSLFIVAVVTAISATSFGLLIGTYAKTYEQASALGPLLIVLAAAIGGIMIPTYLMPAQLKFLSALSPLNWAQSAFIDILVRNADFVMLLPNLGKLILFSLSLLLLVYVRNYKRL